jgi:hypothetical protein
VAKGANHFAGYVRAFAFVEFSRADAPDRAVEELVSFAHSTPPIASD